MTTEKEPTTDAPAAAETVKPAVAESQKPLPSRTLHTILSGMVKGGRSAQLTLMVNGTSEGKLTVSALSDLGEVLGTYEITEAGVKPL